MVDTFTLNQVIRYVYHDCSQVENQMLDELALTDWTVREEIKNLQMAKNHLPKALFSAHPTTLTQILEYSRKTA